jgi:hypothetical protein
VTARGNGGDRSKRRRGDRRDPRIVAIEPRLDHLPDGGFDEKKLGQGFERHAPARIDRRRQGHGKTSGDQRAEVGDEPQQECDDAPKDRARNADEIEANGEDDAEGSVSQGSEPKKPAEPPRRVIPHQGRAVQIARFGKHDEAVAYRRSSPQRRKAPTPAREPRPEPAAPKRLERNRWSARKPAPAMRCQARRSWPIFSEPPLNPGGLEERSASLILRRPRSGRLGGRRPWQAHRQCAPPASLAILFSAALSASVRAAKTGQSGLRIASTRPEACGPVILMRLFAMRPRTI